jgi:hypothetical protein
MTALEVPPLPPPPQLLLGLYVLPAPSGISQLPKTLIVTSSRVKRRVELLEDNLGITLELDV